MVASCRRSVGFLTRTILIDIGAGVSLGHKDAYDSCLVDSIGGNLGTTSYGYETATVTTDRRRDEEYGQRPKTDPRKGDSTRRHLQFGVKALALAKTKADTKLVVYPNIVLGGFNPRSSPDLCDAR